MPTNPPLTNATQYKLVGTALPRVDIPIKTNGKAVYGIDVRVPGMVYAAIKHCPSLGGTLAKIPSKPSGTLAVVPCKVFETRGANIAGTVNAVAVVAGDTWTAMKAARSLKVSWKIPATSAALSSPSILTQAQNLMDNGVPAVAESQGDATGALASATATIDATYGLPYVPHVCMEVLNCTVDFRGSTCEIWAPTQGAALAQRTASQVTGLPTSAITVHTTFLGGGLGRKIEQDFISQAVEVAKAVGRPVKLMWPREEDFTNDQYRPTALIRVKAGVDAGGNVSGWTYRNVSPSISGQRGRLKPGAVDSSATEGATNLAYDLGARVVDYVLHPAAVPIGYWRSVGSSINTFAVESAIDELAQAAGTDPLAFRRRLLASHPRALAVVNAAADLSPWRTSLQSGHAWGMAFAESFGTLVCQIVDVSGSASAIRVHRVACAVDCGTAINPGSVEMQMQGGIVHGLAAALWGGVNFTNGRADATNFHNYAMLRMRHMPQVDVTIINSGEPLGGIGEPGVPPIAPAVANAYYRLTGIRLRSLPLFP